MNFSTPLHLSYSLLVLSTHGTVSSSSWSNCTIAALIVDRLIGDPQSPFHPVALLGWFIGKWGQPQQYSPEIQRFAGVLLWMVTAALFALPFYCFAAVAPWFLYLVGAPILLKFCFAWRSLEEHTLAVVNALHAGVEEGRDQVKMLVSRDTTHLEPGTYSFSRL